MSSIRHAHTLLKSLVRAQEDVVHSFDTAALQIAEDKRSILLELKGEVENMIPAEGTEHYKALSRAGNKVGLDHDFFGIATKWMEEDRVNREEKQLLEVKWGTRQNVAEQMESLDKDISMAQNLLDVISPEIEAFGKATEEIRKHNEKYPKRQINEANHDKYEKGNFWRTLLGITYINRAPYEAGRIVKAYTDKFGDYYEDAKEMDGLRRSEARFKKDLEDKTKAREDLSEAGARMVSLDVSHRGVEGIAAKMREIAADFILKSEVFSDAVASEVGTVSARQAKITAARVNAYSELTSFLQKHKLFAQEALGVLQDNTKFLGKSLDSVGEKTVSFDYDRIQKTAAAVSEYDSCVVGKPVAASRILREMRSDVSDPQKASHEIQSALSYVRNLGDQPLTPDFQELRAGVKVHVDAYEKEQRRLAEIRAEKERQERIARDARRAAEAQALAEAARIAFNIVQQRQQRQQQRPTPSVPRAREGIRMGGLGIKR